MSTVTVSRLRQWLLLILNRTLPFTGFVGPVSIDSAGKVAFAAVLSGSGPYTGIFTGPDPIVDKVIGTPKALFGWTTNGVGIGNHALNDAGQIAFWYYPDDGRMGVALATPSPLNRAIARRAKGRNAGQPSEQLAPLGSSIVVHDDRWLRDIVTAV